jgi:hypothetical protein
MAYCPVCWKTRTRSIRPTIARTKRIALAPRRSRHTEAPAVCIAATAAARSPHRRHAPGAARPRSRHQIVPADLVALPVTMPGGHPHTPTASPPTQPHPGHRAGPDPLRTTWLTRECLPPPRPRRRQHSSSPPSTSPAEPGPPSGRRAGAPLFWHCGRPLACGGLAGFRARLRPVQRRSWPGQRTAR